MTTPAPHTLAAPIINSPYEEPAFHWHIVRGEPPEKRAGRRLASYFFRVPERAARGRKPKKQVELFEETATGQEYLLDNANLIRQRLADWRGREYDGASRVTRELINLWRSEDRGQRIFFTQIEAAEAVIFLTEGPADLRQGTAIPPDEPGPKAREAGYRGFGVAFERIPFKVIGDASPPTTTPANHIYAVPEKAEACDMVTHPGDLAKLVYRHTRTLT